MKQPKRKTIDKMLKNVVKKGYIFFAFDIYKHEKKILIWLKNI